MKFTMLNITMLSLQDAGRYECRAKNSIGVASNFTTLNILPEEPTTTTGSPCQPSFCLNGGTCFFIQYMHANEYSCQCAEGFKGYRCENKDVQTSEISRLWPVATLDTVMVQNQDSEWTREVIARISVDLDETTRMLQRYWGK